MNNKKIYSIILGAATMCGLCGCGNQNKESSSTSSEGNNNNSSSTQSVDEKTLVSYHTPEAIKNRGELVVGVKTGGFEFFKNKEGENVGYEVSFAKEIAQNIGENVKVRYVESEIEPMLDSLEKGEIDMALASLEASQSLKDRFTLTDSYWPWKQSASPIYILSTNKEKYKSLSEMSSAKIAVIKDTIQSNVVEHYMPNAERIECENVDQCIEKLKAGEIDAIVAEDADIEEKIKGNKDIIKSSITVPENPDEQGLFIALMKDNTELQMNINSTIRTNKENKNLENWILEAYNQALSLTSTESDDENKNEETKKSN